MIRAVLMRGERMVPQPEVIRAVLMAGARIVPNSEVIGAILSEGSPCCVGGPTHLVEVDCERPVDGPDSQCRRWSRCVPSGVADAHAWLQTARGRPLL